jgi:hypothetical protein
MTFPPIGAYATWPAYSDDTGRRKQSSGTPPGSMATPSAMQATMQAARQLFEA